MSLELETKLQLIKNIKFCKDRQDKILQSLDQEHQTLVQQFITSMLECDAYIKTLHLIDPSWNQVTP